MIVDIQYTYFQQLPLDLRVAGTVFTKLIDNDLSRQDYYKHSDYYLPSYSLQSDNPYSYSTNFNQDSFSNEFSGYYIKVRSSVHYEHIPATTLTTTSIFL
jgi:hypothetical protein